MQFKVVRRWSNQLQLCGSLLGQYTSFDDFSTSWLAWLHCTHMGKSRERRECSNQLERRCFKNAHFWMGSPPADIISFGLSFDFLCHLPFAFCNSLSIMLLTLTIHCPVLTSCQLHKTSNIHLWPLHLLLQFDSSGNLIPPFEFCTYLHFTLFGNSNAT